MTFEARRSGNGNKLELTYREMKSEIDGRLHGEVAALREKGSGWKTGGDLIRKVRTNGFNTALKTGKVDNLSQETYNTPSVLEVGNEISDLFCCFLRD